ncbi:hypothetical protein QYZ41_25630 [Vibrio parahaemolyticus]|nr:hypothetical protein [Vibrio parahaemolyticus]MDN4723870.1 hypothetical protein [Vibrio parahaemolyticus]
MKRETRFVEFKKALSDLLYDRSSMRLHLLLGQLAIEFGSVEGGEIAVGDHEDFHQHDTTGVKQRCSTSTTCAVISCGSLRVMSPISVISWRCCWLMSLRKARTFFNSFSAVSLDNFVVMFCSGLEAKASTENRLLKEKARRWAF